MPWQNTAAAVAGRRSPMQNGSRRNVTDNAKRKRDRLVEKLLASRLDLRHLSLTVMQIHGGNHGSTQA
jgi:hypothetical protein